MKETVGMFKMLSDESRLRILFILQKKELCVCQIMGVLNMSQPLVSRNLSLLVKAGFLDDRKEGKLVYYRIKDDILKKNKLILNVANEFLKGSRRLTADIETLKDCTEFQKKTGRCDMKTLKEFMEYRMKKKMTKGKRKQ